MKQNVDPQELAKFSAQAEQWWEPNGPMRTLHDINPARLAYIESKRSLKGLSVLDVGCGAGVLSEALAKQGASVTAIDQDESVLNAAKQHQADLDIDYQLKDVTQLAKAQPESFDIITCLEMLEHVPDPSAIINACSTLCKPSGALFFSTLNRNCKSFIQAIVGAEYLLNLLPKGTHEYQRFLKPSELIAICRKAGLQCEQTQGLHYNPLTRKASLTDDISVNYMLYCIKPSLG